MPKSFPALTGLMVLSVLIFVYGDQPLAPVGVKTSLSANTVPLDGEVVFSIELSWNGVLDDVRIDKVAEPVTENLVLRGRGSANRVIGDSLGGNRAFKRFDFYFKPQATGRARIKPVNIMYVYRGRPHTVFSDAAFFEISPPVEKSREVFMPGSVLLWGLLLLFMAAVFFVTIRFFLVRRGQKPSVEQRLDIGEKYHRLLQTTIHPSNGQERENRADMLKLLDSYLMEKTGQTLEGAQTREAMLAGIPGDEKVKERVFKMLREMKNSEEDGGLPAQRMYAELDAFFKAAQHNVS